MKSQIKSRRRFEHSINWNDQPSPGCRHNLFDLAGTRQIEKDGTAEDATIQDLRRRSKIRRMRTMSLPCNVFSKSYSMESKASRKPRYSLAIIHNEEKSSLCQSEEAIKLRKQLIIARFRSFVKRVIAFLHPFINDDHNNLLLHVTILHITDRDSQVSKSDKGNDTDIKTIHKTSKFHASSYPAILAYAQEKGEHDKISSDPRMRLEVQQQELVLDKSMLFDANTFKAAGQVYFPEWAKRATYKNPSERTEKEIDMLVHLMKQLKVFRRYSKEIQRIMCKVVRYDRFGRGRVVIRKGHVGMSFYIIYSGQVSFSLQDDEQKCDKPSEHYNLYPGDAFGELALLREDGVRAATIICQKTSELISIEKQDLQEMGVMNILQKEMENRVECFRQLEIFSAWPTDLVRKVAEEGRSMKYQSFAVIDRNISMSDMVYIITEGRCHVLRYLELSHNKKWSQLQRKQKRMFQIVDNVRFSYPQRDMTCSRLSTYSNVTHHTAEYNNIRRYHSNPHISGRKTSSKNRQRMVKSAFPRTGEGMKPPSRTTRSPIPSNIAQSTDTVREYHTEGNNKMHWTESRSMPSQDTRNTIQLTGINHTSSPSRLAVRMPSACNSTPGRRRAASSWSSSTEVQSSKYYHGSTTQSEQSVGAFMRIDVLGEHDVAGLQLITRMDEEPGQSDMSESRQLMLVSRGCNVICVPVETLKKYSDPETIAKMKEHEKIYPNDDELLDIYAEKSNWNTYKEAILSKTLKELEKERALFGKLGRNKSVYNQLQNEATQASCRTSTRLSYVN